MSFYQSLTSRFLDAMTKRAAVRVYEHLTTLDSEMLEQSGISPELLAKGPVAYPWRMDPSSTDKAELVSVVADDRAIRMAIQELNACTDAELSDLGLSRSGIPEAVRFGRPGIEFPQPTESHRAAA